MANKEPRSTKFSSAPDKQPSLAIEFSADEYRHLLELAYCGNWLINSWRDDDAIEVTYDALEDKLLSYATKAGLPEAVEREGGHNLFSRQFETSIHNRFVPDYENRVFWDELSQRLAWRDIERSLGVEAVTRMGSSERAAVVERLEDKYWQEFDRHGVDHVTVMTSDEAASSVISQAWLNAKEAEA